MIEDRLRGLFAPATGLGEVDVRLHRVGARRTVGARIHLIEHTPIVWDEYDEVLTGVDNLGIERRCEVSLEVRADVQMNA